MLLKSILFLAITISFASEVKEITGTVERVIDGDTFILLTTDSTKLRIRLAGLDTPERGEPGADEATQFVIDQCLGREVRVEFKAFDKYSRVVGIVWVDTLNLNRAIIDKKLTKQKRNKNISKQKD